MLLLVFMLCGCSARDVPELKPEHHKRIVTSGTYLADDNCWGGVSLHSEGVWIPVQIAVDEMKDFIRIGITSRTCEIQSIITFVKNSAPVPQNYLEESHAEKFPFVLSNFEKLSIAKKDVLTTGSTINVIYSPKVKFYEGYIMLGAKFKNKSTGKEFFNVTRIRLISITE